MLANAAMVFSFFWVFTAEGCLSEYAAKVSHCGLKVSAHVR